MSHFRDRVILKERDHNIPQLPSGKRAAVNVPTLISSVVVALGVNQTPLYINNTHDLTAAVIVPTQTKNATTP